jgi:catechol 1,2-dioxygenase
MTPYTRRDFFRQGCIGLAVAGTGGLMLRAGVGPTPSSGSLGDYARLLAQEPRANDQQPAPPAKWAPTEDNILGPYYRAGAPFRAKITPPQEAGTVLVVSGRVWGDDSRKPLKNAVLDIWQANAAGRYDNDDSKNPPAKDVFKNRARLITDENGYYEYETVHPGPYKIGPNAWRPSHVHYLVRAQGYRNLVTQLYFKDDPHNKTDEFIKDSLIIEPRSVKLPNGTIEVGVFDIVLAAAK